MLVRNVCFMSLQELYLYAGRLPDWV